MSHYGGSGGYSGGGGGGGYHSGYDRGRDMSRGGGGDSRDRSRSREYGGRGGGGYGGGGGGYGGGGGGGYGGRGGYGGGRGGGFGGRGGGRYDEPRPSSMMVKVNYFPVQIESQSKVDAGEYVQYDVRIIDGTRVKKKDAEGNFIEPFQFIVVPRMVMSKDSQKKDERAIDLSKGGNELSRRIMTKLVIQEREKDSSFFLAFDGSFTAYAPLRLFTEGDTSARQVDEKGKSTESVYGPADKGGHHAPQAKSSLFKYFYVRVKKECDEDEEDADRVKSVWFVVRLTEVGVISKQVVQRFLQGQNAELEYAEKIQQMMDIILKSSQIFVGMHSFGRSPRTFFFHHDQQEQLLQRTQGGRGKSLFDVFVDPNMSYAGYVGLNQAVRLCQGGNAFVSADAAIGWVNREHYYSRGQNHPRAVCILDEESSSIAGVRVPSLNSPIRDPQTQRAIEENIRKMQLHVKFTRKSNPEFEKKLRERNPDITDSQIRRKNVISRRNVSMRSDAKTKNACILFGGANNPDEYSFETGRRDEENKDGPPPEVHTIFSHKEKKYGYRLRYPNMPIIYVGKYGWFPVEEVYQAFGKMKSANHPSQVTQVLSYYDANAGSACIANVEELSSMFSRMNKFGMNIGDILRLFNLRKSDRPLELRAQVLSEPVLTFLGDERANIRNGSWDLRNKRFMRSADLPSFAVVDFSSRDGRAIRPFMEKLFTVMERHEMQIPSIPSDCVGQLTVGASDAFEPNQIYDACCAAIQSASNFFLYDRDDFYRRNDIWFKTMAHAPDGSLSECLVIPPPSHVEGQVALILRPDEAEYTHIVNHNGETFNARIMVRVDGQRDPIDPFNFKYKWNHRSGRIEYFCRRSEREGWSSCRSVDHVFRLANGAVVEKTRVASHEETMIVDATTVECPAMLFAYLPSDESAKYFLVKMVTNFFLGIQSQCAVRRKFEDQKAKDQYCSNIALKVNTKLMSKQNNARAWETATPADSSGSPQAGIPWVSDVPTMVIGLGLSHGIGHDSVSVIAGTVSLDAGCMQLAHALRVQSRATVISEPILSSLIKSLALQFFHHNGVKPKRVLVYREGLSDGTFDRAKASEIKTIRQVLYDVEKESDPNFDCPYCQGHGCIFCTPLITYVVCQTQNSIRVVPSVERRGKDKNVFSGTCVDQSIYQLNSVQVSLQDCDGKRFSQDLGGADHVRIFTDVDQDGFDFVLVAQGGLKGTSKPVFYRVVMNENAVYTNDPGSTPLTKKKIEECTYCMSYQYGTATKAVRNVPPVYYAKRNAELGMGYLNYLRGLKGAMVQDDEGDFPIVSVNLENEDPEEIKVGRDGVPVPRFMFVRKQMNKEDDLARRLELLPHFSPYRQGGNGTHDQSGSPFRPHLAA